MEMDDGVNPCSYENSNEIYSKMSKKDGAFSMGKSERYFNFSKFIALNDEIVRKGLL